MDKIVAVAGLIVIIGGAVAILVKLTAWASRVAHRFQEFLDDWQGEPARPGIAARRPGVVERLSVIEHRLGGVESQLRPNGGETLRDAIDRVESAVTPDGTGGAS